ncbi:MAG: MFS transporter [Actinobacteria bacterium]|nr:MFS transporter [Actinomycetota bacterium]
MHIYLLICLLITHLFIDMAASTVNPILEPLGSKYYAADVAMGLVAALLSASLSFSQLLFGYIYDRFGAYWLIPLAVLVAGVCLGCVGLIDSFALLLVLVVAAGLAIGAFHPGGAALAGGLADKRRPLTIAIFVCAGALGVAAAPVLITRLVNAQGLRATAWLFVPAVPVFVIALLAFRTCRRLPRPQIETHPKTHSLRESIFSRSLILLFILSASRSFSIIIVPVGMSFLMSEKIADKARYLLSTGNASALFGLSVGFGGLLSGLFIRPEVEKRGIIISLIIAGPLLTAFPLLSGGWLLVIIVLAGLAVGSTIPLVTAIGQRLIPESSAVVSSILMGVAWGVSGIAAPLIVTWLGPLIGYSLAMPLLIAAGIVVALVATLILPPVMHPQTGSRLAASPTMP